MKVRDLIKDFAGKKVRIGAIDGSCFFWIGTVTDDLLKDMDVLTEVFRKRYDKAWERAKKVTPISINANAEKLLKLIEDIKKGKCSVAKDWQSQRKKQKSRLDSFEVLNNAFNQYEKAYYEKMMFTPLNDREVKEIYDSQIEKDVTIIRVEGYDNGNAWDESEWKGLAKE